MKALVTGGAGFLGSTLVDRLIAEGHPVDVIDDLSSGSLLNLADARADRSAELRIHQADARSADVVELIARRPPEVVFHLVAPGDPEGCVVAGVRVIAGALASGATKVVLVVGAGAIADEPVSPLGVMEAALIDLLRLHRERDGLEFTALVVGSVYGPRQIEGRGVVATFAHRLLAGEPVPVPAGGAAVRDFVYVDDCIDALVRAADRGGGLVLNIGTGIGTSVTELHRLMVEAVDDDPGTVPVIGAAGDEPPVVVLDPARTKLHLGWSPWTPLGEGVAATLRWTAAQLRGD